MQWLYVEKDERGRKEDKRVTRGQRGTAGYQAYSAKDMGRRRPDQRFFCPLPLSLLSLSLTPKFYSLTRK
ncbi:hypothetical protein V8C44DRAFT_324131 [Trichoderma aethiopicum]